MPIARRKRVAAQLLGLWVWAVVLVPFLHGLHHELDHTHGPLGHIARVDWSEFFWGHHHGADRSHEHDHHHHHASAGHQHDPQASGEQKDPDPKSPRRAHHDPTQHGSGSLQHLDAWFQICPIIVLPTGACFELTRSPHTLPLLRERHRPPQGVDGPRAPPV